MYAIQSFISATKTECNGSSEEPTAWSLRVTSKTIIYRSLQMSMQIAKCKAHIHDKTRKAKHVPRITSLLINKLESNPLHRIRSFGIPGHAKSSQNTNNMIMNN